MLEFHDIGIDVSINAPNLVTFEKIGEVLTAAPTIGFVKN